MDVPPLQLFETNPFVVFRLPLPQDKPRQNHSLPHPEGKAQSAKVLIDFSDAASFK
jgi:hypothetical protein